MVPAWSWRINKPVHVCVWCYYPSDVFKIVLIQLQQANSLIWIIITHFIISGNQLISKLLISTQHGRNNGIPLVYIKLLFIFFKAILHVLNFVSWECAKIKKKKAPKTLWNSWGVQLKWMNVMFILLWHFTISEDIFCSSSQFLTFLRKHLCTVQRSTATDIRGLGKRERRVYYIIYAFTVCA